MNVPTILSGPRVGTLLGLIALIPAVTCDAQTDNWPQWRGPLGTGVAPHAQPPITWSEEEHVRWKTSIPGRGHSTPAVWNDHVFLTTAVPTGEAFDPIYSQAPGAHDNAPVTHRQKFLVLALSRLDGTVIWQRQVRQAIPHEGGHFTSTFASPSPATDGRFVIACFGSQGLYCLDTDGNVVWEKQLGQMDTKHGHGEGTSPVLFGESVIVNWDHEGDSFMVVLDKRTGQERWRKSRREVTSWATPIVVAHDDRQLIIVCGTDRVRAYDLKTGEVIWKCGGLSHNIVASPVAANGIVFVGSSYEKRAMLAIRLTGAKGDITDSDQVVWQRNRATPYVPSPLLYQGTLYFLRHYQGILTRVTAETGEELPGPIRLGQIRDVYASPVAADGRIYISDLDGQTLVMSSDPIPRLLAMNRLDDSFSASAAIVGSDLFLRGRRSLYCLANTNKSDDTKSSP